MGCDRWANCFVLNQRNVILIKDETKDDFNWSIKQWDMPNREPRVQTARCFWLKITVLRSCRRIVFQRQINESLNNSGRSFVWDQSVKSHIFQREDAPFSLHKRPKTINLFFSFSVWWINWHLLATSLQLPVCTGVPCAGFLPHIALWMSLLCHAAVQISHAKDEAEYNELVS